MKKMILAAVAMLAAACMAADEIATMTQVSVTKGYLSVSKGVDVKATMYGSAYDQKVTEFSTNQANALAVSASITTAGVFFARNLTTNCNAVITASFELYPGETLMGRLLTTNVTIYAKTNGVPGVTTNNPAANAASVETILIAQ